MVVNHIPSKNVRGHRCQGTSSHHNKPHRGSRNLGFTLIELMIVVGIIAALAAVGLPQFRVFLMRSKQSQAKIMGSNVSTALKNFYAEWGVYFSDFRDIGYAPEGFLDYDINLDSPARLPSHYPKAAASGFAGSIGGGNAVIRSTSGYSMLYYYCNGDLQAPTNADPNEPLAPGPRGITLEGNPNCKFTGMTPGFLSELTSDSYRIYMTGNLDEDVTRDVWGFCYNFFDSRTCPDSGHGLKLVINDINDKSALLNQSAALISVDP